MAYATGTGANQQDFLDAVRSFALGLGWTIVLWDTVNKRLYLEKGACHVALEWYNANITTYPAQGASAVVISEGYIRGSLVHALTTGLTYTTFAGSAMTSISGNLIKMRQMQGPFVQWFLFSNATGDYINAIVQVAADRYMHIGFGNIDKGGLTHSGGAYMHSDPMSPFYRTNSTYPTADPSIDYNDPAMGASYLGSGNSSYDAAAMHAYCIDGLPAGFPNSIAVASLADSNYGRSQAIVMPLRNVGTISKPSEFPSSAIAAARLLDHLVATSGPGWTNFVPMMGIPIVISNELKTQACAIGSIPDMRCINMQGMSPQQEITLGGDTWKVFPMNRQTNWDEAKLQENPSSGHFAFAYKKIV